MEKDIITLGLAKHTAGELLVTLGLGELLWSEEQAMSVSGHRSAEQMRRDYDECI